MSVAKRAGKTEWLVYRLSGDLEDALQESGGEVTPEVEAIEAELAKYTDQLAEAAVAMRQDARAMQAMCGEEKRRVDGVKKLHERREAYALRLLRIVAAERGPKFRVGTFTVRIEAGVQKAVEVMPVLEMPQDVRDALEASGHLRYEPKVDKRGVLVELKKGAEVPGYELARGPAKVVVR